MNIFRFTVYIFPGIEVVSSHKSFYILVKLFQYLVKHMIHEFIKSKAALVVLTGITLISITVSIGLPLGNPTWIVAVPLLLKWIVLSCWKTRLFVIMNHFSKLQPPKYALNPVCLGIENQTLLLFYLLILSKCWLSRKKPNEALRPGHSSVSPNFLSFISPSTSLSVYQNIYI